MRNASGSLRYGILACIAAICVFTTSYGLSKPDGLYKSYYENGILAREGAFKDDKEEGVFKSFYEDGKLKDESTYEDGVLQGRRKTYYPNGTVKSREYYKDDLLDGRIKRYRENGTIEIIDTYVNGRKTNRKTYDPQGRLEFDNDYGEDASAAQSDGYE